MPWNVVRDNHVFDNPHRGIFVRAGASQSDVRDNVVTGTAGTDGTWHGGIVVEGSNNSVVRNFACGNSVHDILLTGGSGRPTSDANSVKENEADSIQDNGTGNTVEDNGSCP